MNYFQQKESGTSLSGLCSETGWRIGFGTSIGTGDWSVANSPDVSLSDFFSASVYEKSWRIRRESSELIRFGLLWKIYDLVAEKGVAWSPPCLQEHLPGFRGWLLGGVSGMDFLVESDGLTGQRDHHKTLSAPGALKAINKRYRINW